MLNRNVLGKPFFSCLGLRIHKLRRMSMNFMPMIRACGTIGADRNMGNRGTVFESICRIGGTSVFVGHVQASLGRRPTLNRPAAGTDGNIKKALPSLPAPGE
jgi:hypothetical protein